MHCDAFFSWIFYFFWTGPSHVSVTSPKEGTIQWVEGEKSVIVELTIRFTIRDNSTVPPFSPS